MAELSVASGVAGLMSLGITICKGILIYYDSYRGSQGNIDNTCALVETGKFNKNVIDTVDLSIKSCTQGTKCLRRRLAKIRSAPSDAKWKTRLGSTIRKTLYPFQESTLVQIREFCVEVKDNLALALAALNVFSKVFIVIDALDECSDAEDVRSILIAELKKLPSRICLLVMLQPIPNLETLLEDAVFHGPSYLGILVNKTTRRKIKNALEMLQEGLDSIYEELVIRIKLQNPKDHADLAIKVLGWIFYAVKLLTITPVQHALAVEHRDRDLDEDGIPDRDLLVSDIAATCLPYLQFYVFGYLKEGVTNREVVLSLMRRQPLHSYSAQHREDHLRADCDPSTHHQAVRTLEDEKRVHPFMWVRDYADSVIKGAYFRPSSARGNENIARILIDRGAELDLVDGYNATPLYRASKAGEERVAKRLLDSGGDPLVAVVEMLPKYRADPRARGHYGYNPFYQAGDQGHEEVARILRSGYLRAGEAYECGYSALGNCI
ncbi:hypothetical protein CC78DRAFT_578220 [Lojkania enalia]|uniref:Nephrocystin 3-like N-terminal domain-containing protein n=1 Tax=Lojkania enalia TaxID=147567 RepID=A0A9P4KC48_9PLEO|nr:hypothetical protein CC78DRAFT_578220 [Didymosphaeria enalia]